MMSSIMNALEEASTELQRVTMHVAVNRAPWIERPCELVSYHAPTPTLTEGHHIHPVFLQNRLYGNIQDNTLKYLCSNCHDSVHEWLYWILGNRRLEPKVGRVAKAEAVQTFNWYYREVLALGKDTDPNWKLHLVS